MQMRKGLATVFLQGLNEFGEESGQHFCVSFSHKMNHVDASTTGEIWRSISFLQGTSWRNSPIGTRRIINEYLITKSYILKRCGVFSFIFLR